jgi:branched-chain amino acid transport system permease protein
MTLASLAGRLPGAQRGSIRWVTAIVLIGLFYLVPQIGGSASFRMTQYELILSFLVVGVALNLAMGYGGQFLIGITAVFTLGGYAAVLVAKHHPGGIGLVAMMIIGGIVGAAGGMVIGLPSLRVAGFYLGLVSLFAALVIPTVAMHWNYAGADTGIPLYAVVGFKPQITGESLYIVCASLVLLATLFCWAIVHSRIGNRFAALRTSEELSASIGITGYRTKLLAIFISSTMAGAAGGIYVYTQQFFAPGSSSPNLAILLLAALVIGGAATITGPLIGGAIILGLNQFLGFQSWTGIIFGIILLLFAVFLPSGIVSRVTALGLVPRRVPVRAQDVPGDPRADEVAIAGGARAAARHAPADGDTAAGANLPRWTPIVGVGSEPLTIEGARRTFGGVVAVNDVDLVVERGTIHGLIGSNGSGKTTLLNLISGFYSLDAGSIRIGDYHLERHAAYSVARAGVARTFQSPKLILGGTSLGNVVPAAELHIRCSGPESMLRLPRGIRTNRRARDESIAVLEAIGLGHVIHETADSLPHGTRRLVELARVIAMRPSFVLLDEPAAGLSPTELDLLFVIIKHLATCGVGVLLIEHNVPMVLNVADQMTVLHQGSRLFQGTPEQLRSDQDVASAFLGIDDEVLRAN